MKKQMNHYVNQVENLNNLNIIETFKINIQKMNIMVGMINGIENMMEENLKVHIQDIMKMIL